MAVPRSIPGLVTKDVLVMTFLEGEQITRLKASCGPFGAASKQMRLQGTRQLTCALHVDLPRCQKPVTCQLCAVYGCFRLYNLLPKLQLPNLLNAPRRTGTHVLGE